MKYLGFLVYLRVRYLTSIQKRYDFWVENSDGPLMVSGWAIKWRNSSTDAMHVALLGASA